MVVAVVVVVVVKIVLLDGVELPSPILVDFQTPPSPHLPENYWVFLLQVIKKVA